MVVIMAIVCFSELSKELINAPDKFGYSSLMIASEYLA